MKHNSNQILVVDVESTCWKGKPPIGMQSEIIEIGYCLFDYETNEIYLGGSIFIKPVFSKVSPFCTELTSITQEYLDSKGVSFAEACARLKEINSLGVPWSSYGNYYLQMFIDMCKLFGVSYPFTPQHLNVKVLCTVLLGKKRGLGKSLTAMKLNFEGRHHTGKDDAYNVARILKQFSENRNVRKPFA